jgi:glycosyltransferase involved in cell wall biosynthesis
MPDLSILIPARNEEFLENTIRDILSNMRGDTEIIVVLDGGWPVEPLEQHEKVTVIYYPESIGQRAATNKAAKLSSAKYLMKLDAHCAFDEGFDVKLMEDMQDDWTVVPLMKNLHVFDWVCDSCGKRTYQGPVPEKCDCGSEDFHKDIVWEAKPSPNSTSYRFTKELRFKYFGEYKSKQEGDLVETMSLQGSCFMVKR